MLWKRQAWEPDTCDCRIITVWDAEAAIPVHTLACVERYCPAHQPQGPVTDAFLWADGNWKDNRAYLEYQKQWFLWRTGKRATEPVTPGSIAAPASAEVAERTRLHGLAMRDNVRKNQALTALKADDDAPEWSFEGTGESRTLKIKTKANQAARSRAQAALDIQFGGGAVEVGP